MLSWEGVNVRKGQRLVNFPQINKAVKHQRDVMGCEECLICCVAHCFCSNQRLTKSICVQSILLQCQQELNTHCSVFKGLSHTPMNYERLYQKVIVVPIETHYICLFKKIFFKGFFTGFHSSLPCITNTCISERHTLYI